MLAAHENTEWQAMTCCHAKTTEAGTRKVKKGSCDTLFYHCIQTLSNLYNLHFQTFINHKEPETSIHVRKQAQALSQNYASKARALEGAAAIAKFWIQL